LNGVEEGFSFSVKDLEVVVLLIVNSDVLIVHCGELDLSNLSKLEDINESALFLADIPLSEDTTCAQAHQSVVDMAQPYNFALVHISLHLRVALLLLTLRSQCGHHDIGSEAVHINEVPCRHIHAVCGFKDN
jgi:hypothetical protein